jgi:DNA-binding response OmpR family regulator
MRLLIVEDDLAIAEPLLAGLRHHGFDGIHVACGVDAIAAITNDAFDVVLLDLGLPDMDGLDVCRDIRRLSSVPIIMVTARDEEIDRIVGLELGADDYVSKPFGIRELIARIRAVRRRFDSAAELSATNKSPTNQNDPAQNPAANPVQAPTTRIPMPGIAGASDSPIQLADRKGLSGRSQSEAETGPASDQQPSQTSNAIQPATNDSVVSASTASKAGTATTLIIGALTVDHRTHRVHLNGQEIALTPKEFGLLVVLGTDPGAVVPRMSIIEQVWDEHWYGPTKTLDVHVAQLRQKLGNPGWIETVRGVGYRLADPGVRQAVVELE